MLSEQTINIINLLEAKNRLGHGSEKGSMQKTGGSILANVAAGALGIAAGVKGGPAAQRLISRTARGIAARGGTRKALSAVKSKFQIGRAAGQHKLTRAAISGKAERAGKAVGTAERSFIKAGKKTVAKLRDTQSARITRTTQATSALQAQSTRLAQPVGLGTIVPRPRLAINPAAIQSLRPATRKRFEHFALR